MKAVPRENGLESCPCWLEYWPRNVELFDGLSSHFIVGCPDLLLLQRLFLSLSISSLCSS